MKISIPRYIHAMHINAACRTRAGAAPDLPGQVILDIDPKLDQQAILH